MARPKKKLYTNYQRGANFERRVKEHFENELVKLAPRDIKWFVLRSAGSRGSLDVLVVLTNTKTRHQRVLGIQCKLEKPSYQAMQKFISEVHFSIGIECFYAYRGVKRTIEIYPSLEVSRLLEVKL